MAKKKSAFVLAGESAKDVIRTASKTQRSSIATNEDIIAAYDLQEGSRVSVICKVTRITADVHDDRREELEGLPYVNFGFTPTSGKLKGALITNFMPCYDRKNPQEGVSEQAMEWIFREFQGLDMDTDGWSLAEVEAAADEATSSRPTIALGISCSKIKSGKNRGALAINVRINRLIEDDEDGEDEPAKPVSKPKPSKAEVVSSQEDDEDTEDEVVETKPYVPAVDDEVTYVYTDEDGSEETLTCTVTKVNNRAKTCTLSDGEYGYDDIPFAEVTPVE